MNYRIQLGHPAHAGVLQGALDFHLHWQRQDIAYSGSEGTERLAASERMVAAFLAAMGQGSTFVVTLSDDEAGEALSALEHHAEHHAEYPLGNMWDRVEWDGACDIALQLGAQPEDLPEWEW